MTITDTDVTAPTAGIMPEKPVEHTLHVLDRTGDTRTLWNPENQDEVDAAKETFKRLKGKGYLAYTVGDDGTKGEVIREFDPTAGKIIMSPQLVGG